jgi:hypothetical protein
MASPAAAKRIHAQAESVRGMTQVGCHEASIGRCGVRLIVVEHEQPYSRGEIAVLALGVDTADQISQRHTAACSYILQSSPEYILKADTRLVAPNDDGALDD